MTGYLYIALTVLLTVYGQLIIKWQVGQAGVLPIGLWEKILFLLQICLNPWVASGFFAAFLAALCWMAAITRMELSHAYPFVGSTFVFVLIGSALFFSEALTPLKMAGTALIVLGIIVASQG
jgi:multidrug transporter EmrE-like cation transporter